MIGKDTNLFVFFFHRVILIVVDRVDAISLLATFIKNRFLLSYIALFYTTRRSRTVRFSRRSCQVNHFIGAQLHLMPLRIFLNPGDGTILLILKVSGCSISTRTQEVILNSPQFLHRWHRWSQFFGSSLFLLLLLSACQQQLGNRLWAAAQRNLHYFDCCCLCGNCLISIINYTSTDDDDDAWALAVVDAAKCALKWPPRRRLICPQKCFCYCYWWAEQ